MLTPHVSRPCLGNVSQNQNQNPPSFPLLESKATAHDPGSLRPLCMCVSIFQTPSPTHTHSPSVWPRLVLVATRIYHRLYGEHLTLLHDALGLVLRVVGDVGCAVKEVADPVPAVRSNHAEAAGGWGRSWGVCVSGRGLGGPAYSVRTQAPRYRPARAQSICHGKDGDDSLCACMCMWHTVAHPCLVACLLMMSPTSLYRVPGLQAAMARWRHCRWGRTSRSQSTQT
jgi:hypothetical protein